MREITSCEVCGNTHLHSVINLGKHPLPDDLVKIGDDRQPEEYPVEVLFCDSCKTAHQRFQIPREQLFPRTYHYRARQTQDVLDGMAQLVDSIAKKRPVAGLKVLDIGCNDGSLLTEFQKLGADTYGIEPTDAAADARAAGHPVMRAFFDRQTAHQFVELFGYPDIITFTNVFAHIEDLQGLLDALRIMRKTTTWIVIENHYLGAVLDRHQFDTFYHEHPRTYSFSSFSSIASQLGMTITDVEFPARYGGNIRVTLQSSHTASAPRLLVPNEGTFHDQLLELDRGVKRWRDRKSSMIGSLFLDSGPTACAAFPGRAAVLLRLLGLPREVFDRVYEKRGSKKIGYYVPGTRIPIVSDDEFYWLSHSPVVNLAWHISAEIETNWRNKGFTGPLIPIVQEADFN